jgi:hypothetical protein
MWSQCARWSLLGVFAFIACGGCNRGPTLPKAVPVSGTVTLDGKPLAGASIRFAPIESTPGTGARGSTDNNGKYDVRDRSGEKGVAVGKYRVTIYFSDGGLTSQTPSRRLSEKYTSADQSILTATVPEGGCVVDFALKSKL